MVWPLALFSKPDPNQSPLYYLALFLTKFPVLKRALTYGKLIIVHDSGAGTTLRQSITLKIDQVLQPAPLSRDFFLIQRTNMQGSGSEKLYCGTGFNFLFNADPDPAPHQGDLNRRPLVLQTVQASILSLHASIMNFHGSILILERSCILTLMRVRIRNSANMIRFVTRTWTRGRLRHTRI